MLTKRLYAICDFLHLKEVNYYQRGLVFSEGIVRFVRRQQLLATINRDFVRLFDLAPGLFVSLKLSA